MDDKTHKHRPQPLAMVLLAAAALLAALTLLKLARFSVTSANADSIAWQAAHPAAGRRASPKTPANQASSAVDALKKNNLFAPPSPRQHPVREVIGILGDEALIDGKWYKAGDSVGEARVVAVEPTRVRIVWDGQEKEFTPIGATGEGGPGGRGPGRETRGMRPPPPSSGAPMVVTGSRPGEGRGGPGQLSPEEIEARRQRWNNASPEERERLRNEMRERFGRRDR